MDYGEFVDEVEPMLSHSASRARTSRLHQRKSAVAEVGDSEARAKLEAALRDVASRYARKEGGAISRDGLLGAFRDADEDEDGTLSRDEFLRQLKRLRVALTDDEAAAVFARLDADGSGAVDYREFVTHLVQHADSDERPGPRGDASKGRPAAGEAQRDQAQRRRRERGAAKEPRRPAAPTAR